MLKNKNHGADHITVRRIFIIFCAGLLLLLLSYLVINLSSAYKLDNQITLLTEHPFTVSRELNDLREDMAQIRVRSERLQTYHTEGDIVLVKERYEEIYKNMDQSLDEIAALYLGSEEDIENLEGIYNRIKVAHTELFDFLDQPRSNEEIVDYQEEHLDPLYNAFDKGADSILEHVHNTQLSVYASSSQLSHNTMLWSLAIVAAAGIGIFIFFKTLNQTNKEVYNINQEFNIISRTISETFLIYDRDTPGCEFVAGNAKRVLGISDEELRLDRQKFYKYLCDEDREKIIQRVYAENVDFPWETTAEYRNPYTDEVRQLSLQFYNSIEKGRPNQCIVTVADRTQEIIARTALEDALKNAENANQAKSRFLSRMSHEIRTPLNGIIGMTAIAGTAFDDKNRLEDCLTKIGQSSKHLLMLINDILDMSKIESDKVSLHEEPFDIYQFVNEFVAMVYPQASKKGLEFKEQISGFNEGTALIGDTMRLNQILLNLTSNAIKFTETGGNIAMKVENLSENDEISWLHFSVSDTGIGMDKKAQRRIFQPFEQADSSITKKYGGTGLGMSIAQNLSTLMGGYIKVKSSPGQGTTFTVEIPFKKTNTDIPDAPEEKLKELHVLVVDDEQSVCEYTKALLEKIGIKTQWVLSGTEAVNRVVEGNVSATPIDICFIDLKMPCMDGLETTRQIRKKSGENTPVVIITAYDYSEVEEEALKAGANAFITKPFYLSALYDTLMTATHGAMVENNQNLVDEEESIFKGKNVLIAEDNELNMEIIQELLKMEGAVTEGAENGREALEKFRESPEGTFDFILMDVQMPKMNGYEATRAIRVLDKHDALEIPIIAVTADAFTEDAAAALEAGMNAHVSKPVNMRQLSGVLKRIQKKHRALNGGEHLERE